MTKTNVGIASRIVYRAWGKRLQTLADFDDFVQQGWVEYLQHVQTATNPGDVPQDVWEIGLLIRRLNDWCRHLNRHAKREITTPFDRQTREQPPTDTPGLPLSVLEPEDPRATFDLEWVDVKDFLEQLPDDDAVLVYMKTQRMSLKEIAEALGISYEAAQKRAQRIQGKVKP